MRPERKAETSLTVDARAACQLAGISVATFYRMLAVGKAPVGFKVGAKLRKWHRQEVVDWVNNNFGQLSCE